MYLKTSDKSGYYYYEHTDILTEDEKKAFLREFVKCPDDYFGVVSDFIFENQMRSVSANMIRKIFCIDFEKATSVYNDMFRHYRIKILVRNEKGKSEYGSARNYHYAKDVSFSFFLGKRDFYGTAEEYMMSFPDCVFKNALSFDEITIDNNNLIEEAKKLVSETYGVDTDYSLDHSKKLIGLGNCLIADCSYDTPSDFLKEIYCKCDPRDVDLIVYQKRSEFPHIIHLFDLEWLRYERAIRMQIKEGKDIYPNAKNRSIAQLMTHKTPTVVIVPEINDLLAYGGTQWPLLRP